MKKQNTELVNLIKELKLNARNNNARIWKAIAERLEKPDSRYAEVNVSRIQRYATEGEFIIVPGKVLGSGILNKKVTVAAWQFSKSAETKIKKAGGEALEIRQIMDKNPKGSNIRIIG